MMDELSRRFLDAIEPEYRQLVAAEQGGVDLLTASVARVVILTNAMKISPEEAGQLVTQVAIAHRVGLAVGKSAAEVAAIIGGPDAS